MVFLMVIDGELNGDKAQQRDDGERKDDEVFLFSRAALDKVPAAVQEPENSAWVLPQASRWLEVGESC